MTTYSPKGYSLRVRAGELEMEWTAPNPADLYAMVPPEYRCGEPPMFEHGLSPRPSPAYFKDQAGTCHSLSNIRQITPAGHFNEHGVGACVIWYEGADKGKKVYVTAESHDELLAAWTSWEWSTRSQTALGGE